MAAFLPAIAGAAVPWLLNTIFGNKGNNSNAWSGTPAQQIGTASNYSPYQMAGLEQFAKSAGNYDLTKSPIYSSAQNYLTNTLNSQFNPEQYNQMFEQGVANPTMKTFNEQVMPSIRSQYYSPGAVYGAGLNQAMSKAGTDVTQGLGALKSQYMMQAQQNFANQQQGALQNALGMATAPAATNLAYYQQLFNAKPQTPIVQEAQGGWLQNLLQTLATSIGPTALQGLLNQSQQPQQQQTSGRWNPPSNYTGATNQMQNPSMSPVDLMLQQGRKQWP